MAFVRLLGAAAWAAVFAILLLFAVRNTEPVTILFYFGQAWTAPLVFVVLASFAAGAVFGLVACLPALVRLRREVARRDRELSLRPGHHEAARPPAPATVPDVPSQL